MGIYLICQSALYLQLMHKFLNWFKYRVNRMMDRCNNFYFSFIKCLLLTKNSNKLLMKISNTNCGICEQKSEQFLLDMKKQPCSDQLFGKYTMWMFFVIEIAHIVTGELIWPAFIIQIASTALVSWNCASHSISFILNSSCYHAE